MGMMFLEPMMKAQLEKGVEICKSAKCNVSAKSVGHELMQCSRSVSGFLCSSEETHLFSLLDANASDM